MIKHRSLLPSSIVCQLKNDSQGGRLKDSLPPDAGKLLGVSADELIKFEDSVYGLRTAPKAWFGKVAADFKNLGQYSTHLISVSSCPAPKLRLTNNLSSSVPSKYMLMTSSLLNLRIQLGSTS